ncbi:MAG: hypothetical protein K0Q73_8833 [Paenibacillus sp.]|jgi:hypothetical protein|nr:hypothetical protein [Paenibacillus sp.]
MAPPKFFSFELIKREEGVSLFDVTRFNERSMQNLLRKRGHAAIVG